MFYPTEGFSSEVSGRSFHNGEQPPVMPVMALHIRHLTALTSFAASWSVRLRFHLPHDGNAGRFVQRLRQETAALPTVTVRQGTVKRLLGGAPSYTVQCLPCHSRCQPQALTARTGRLRHVLRSESARTWPCRGRQGVGGQPGGHRRGVQLSGARRPSRHRRPHREQLPAKCHAEAYATRLPCHSLQRR